MIVYCLINGMWVPAVMARMWQPVCWCRTTHCAQDFQYSIKGTLKGVRGMVCTVFNVNVRGSLCVDGVLVRQGEEISHKGVKSILGCGCKDTGVGVKEVWVWMAWIYISDVGGGQVWREGYGCGVNV